MQPDIGITAFSTPYDTPGVNGWQKNPWLPIGTGQEAEGAANCTRDFNNQTFAPGAEPQVAFGRAMCLERARSHDYYLLTLQDHAKFVAAYATFLSTGKLSHAENFTGEPHESKMRTRVSKLLTRGSDVLALLETGSAAGRGGHVGSSTVADARVEYLSFFSSALMVLGFMGMGFAIAAALNTRGRLHSFWGAWSRRERPATSERLPVLDDDGASGAEGGGRRYGTWTSALNIKRDAFM
jgi:hypothetical protein